MPVQPVTFALPMNDSILQISKDEASLMCGALIDVISVCRDALELEPLNANAATEMETARHLLSKISIHIIKQHNGIKSKDIIPVAGNPELN